MADVITRRLRAAASGALIAHFRALAPEDRRLRFGAGLGDAAIASYVQHMNFERHAVYGVHADDLSLAGAAHVALGEGYAEFGVSVLEGWRKRGIGSALFARALDWARNHYVKVLFTHCLAENNVMMHIARKSKMRIVTDRGEADAHLDLVPPDSASIARELFADRLAVFDYALKSHVIAAGRLGSAMAGAPARDPSARGSG